MEAVAYIFIGVVIGLLVGIFLGVGLQASADSEKWRDTESVINGLSDLIQNHTGVASSLHGCIRDLLFAMSAEMIDDEDDDEDDEDPDGGDDDEGNPREPGPITFHDYSPTAHLN